MWLAQVQVETPLAGLGAQSQPTRLRFHVALQRHGWYAVGQCAHLLAHHELLLDQPHPRRLASAEDGKCGFGHFGEARLRSTAQRREGFGQSHGVHHLGR